LPLVFESPELAALLFGAECWRGDWSDWAHRKSNPISAAFRPRSTKFVPGFAALRFLTHLCCRVRSWPWP